MPQQPKIFLPHFVSLGIALCGNVLIFLLVFALISCKTTAFHVPGEKKIVIENIYSEYFSIAEEYFKQKNYSKAAEFYEKAASSKEFHNAAFSAAARSYALAKNWDAALKIFLEIQKLDKKNLSIMQSLAYIYAMQSDFETAEELYSSVIKENPDISEALVNFTIILLTQEKYEEAKANLELLKEKFPDEKKIKEISEKIATWEESQKQDEDTEIPDELKTEDGALDFSFENQTEK